MQTARRLRFLASLLFVFCVAVAITSPAQTIAKTNPPPDAEPEAPQHGNSRVRNLHVRLDGTATSENWSGYLVTGATGSVNSSGGHLFQLGEGVLPLLGWHRWRVER